MAINKDSNGYTFGFAIVLVIVVGSILALLAMGLKPMQEKNDEVKKKLDILSAMMDADEKGITRKNADSEFEKYVDEGKIVKVDDKYVMMEDNPDYGTLSQMNSQEGTTSSYEMKNNEYSAILP